MRDSAYCKTFSLHQQTPMLNFQPDQAGSTLRATEVKPQLDRFLLNRVPPPEGGIPAQWRIGEEGNSLAYKLSITANGIPQRTHYRRESLEKLLQNAGNAQAEYRKAIQAAIQQLPPKRDGDFKMPTQFFGNMTSKTGFEEIQAIVQEYKEAVYFTEPLILKIHCMNKDLLEFVVRYLPDFFLLYGFGTRAGKGFGSFLADGIAENQILKRVQKYYPKYIYIYIPHGGSWEDQLKRGNKLMQLMKGTYLVGLFRNQTPPILSDKQFIKSGQFQQGEPGAGDESFQFVRALLGMPGVVECQQGGQKVSYHVVSQDGTVQRFACPVRVKIIGPYVLFLPDEIPQKLNAHNKFLFLNQTQFDLLNETAKDDKQALRDQFMQEGYCLEIPQDFDTVSFVLSFGVDYNNKYNQRVKGYSYPPVKFRGRQPVRGGVQNA